MAIVEIRYEAKCKHCRHFKAVYTGKRTRHKCEKKDIPLTLKDRACPELEL